MMCLAACAWHLVILVFRGAIVVDISSSINSGGGGGGGSSSSSSSSSVSRDLTKSQFFTTLLRRCFGYSEIRSFSSVFHPKMLQKTVQKRNYRHDPQVFSRVVSAGVSAGFQFYLECIPTNREQSMTIG
jgi:hypothetical protein